MNSWPGSGSPTLAESGGIDGGPGVWNYQPSIGANYRGDVAMVFSQSSTSSYPLIMYTARLASAGGFEMPALVKASPAYSNSDRWGDYASVTSDPADESLWVTRVTHEWSRSSAEHDWGTWWARIVISSPALSLASARLSDGNGDQSVDPNECNNLSVVLRNDGNFPASNIVAVLSSSTPGIRILQSNSAYPNLPAGGIGTNVTFLKISSSPFLACGTFVDFTLAVDYGFASTNISFSLPSGNGVNYAITSSTGSAIVPGTDDIGNHGDDVSTTIALPFPYRFYTRFFTNVSLCSNGHLEFDAPRNDYFNVCLPAPGWSNAIFPHWDDLVTDHTPDEGIFTSISGSAPNRIFNIEWRAAYLDSLTPVNFEARLYENQMRFDLIYGEGNENGTSATVGGQKDETTAAQFECNSGGLSPGLQLTFQQTCTDGGGACVPPVPVLLSPARNGTNFTFSFATAAGFTYNVQYKNLLTDASWQTLQSLVGDGTVKTITVPISASSQRFFRLQVQ